MKKLLFMLSIVAAASSCKKESGDCYKCIPAANQTDLWTNDTIICEGHPFFDKAEQDRLTDLNAQEIKCKKVN